MNRTKFFPVLLALCAAGTASAATYIDEVNKGSTDYSATIYIFDSTTGLPETAVAHNETGIDLWYRREGAAVTAITEAALSALTDAHSDGGLEPIDDGEYRLDLPDAALAAGADWVDIGGHIDGMVVRGGRIRLKNVNPIDDINATCQPYQQYGILMGVGCAVTSYTHSTGTVVLAGSLAIEANDQFNNSVVQLCTSLGCQSGTVEDYVDSTQSLVLYDPLLVDIEGDTITATVFATPQTGNATTPPTAAQIVDEFETQSTADPTGFRVNVMEVNGTAQTANDNAADINAILVDTNELQTDWVNGGRLDLIIDAILADTDALETRLTALRAGYLDALDAGGVGLNDITIAGLAAGAQTDVQMAAAAALDAEDGANFTAIPKTAVLDYIEQFACDSGDTDTCVDSTLDEADGFWRGVALRSLSGTTAGMERCVVASDQSSTDVTVAPPFPASLGTGTVQLVASPLCAGVDPTYTP